MAISARIKNISDNLMPTRQTPTAGTRRCRDDCPAGAGLILFMPSAIAMGALLPGRLSDDDARLVHTIFTIRQANA